MCAIAYAHACHATLSRVCPVALTQSGLACRLKRFGQTLKLPITFATHATPAATAIGVLRAPLGIAAAIKKRRYK